MKSVDDVVAELRLQIAKNLARDVGIVSIDCEDALALCQMAADFAVLLAEGKRAISALQREADGLREALAKLHEACEPFQTEVSRWAPDFPPNSVPLGDHDPELSVTWADLLSLDIAAMEARAALKCG
jgi:hypothetical protein